MSGGTPDRTTVKDDTSNQAEKHVVVRGAVCTAVTTENVGVGVLSDDYDGKEQGAFAERQVSRPAEWVDVS